MTRPFRAMDLSKLHFMGGVPRAGATVLGNILDQNPAVYVSPTSGLISAVRGIKENWQENTNFRAEGLERVLPRIENMIRGVLYGYYRDELDRGLVVIDRNRAWVDDIATTEKLLGRPARILYPYRDIKTVVASLEVIHRQGGFFVNNNHHLKLLDQRVEKWTAPDGVVGAPLVLLHALIERGQCDRLLMLPYDRLVTAPGEVLERIHGFLGLSSFHYRLDAIPQSLTEDDTAHGFPPGNLHRIRSHLSASGTDPDSVLGTRRATDLDRRFHEVDTLAAELWRRH